MITKRTHGPCTCPPPKPGYTGIYHNPDCPSLYPAQQEPDALTRLVRYVRESSMHEAEKEEALALISEARGDQRMALAYARNETLDKVLTLLAKRSDMYSEAAKEMPLRAHLNDAKGAEDDMVASAVRRMKETTP